MKSTVTKSGTNERLIEVEIAEEELVPHFDSACRKYQKNVRLEGFRKGKVPLSLIKRLYGEAIKADAIDDVVESVFREVSQKENLRPVAPAKVEDVNYQPGSGLKFRARVEVYPEIEIKNYKGLTVERETYQVGDEDIQHALEEVRESMAVMEPVEGPAEEGHFVLADFQQVDVSGVPMIGKKYEDRFFQLDISGGYNELAGQLVGVQAGEKRRVQLTPDEPAGESGTDKQYFEVTVKEVKAKRLPEIDDELAKDTGKFQTLEELKADIRETLARRTQVSSRNQMRNQLIDELLKKNPFDLPNSMVEQYLDVLARNVLRDANGQVDEETVREQYRPNAIWTLKWEVAKDKIAELENITVTDQDREAFIKRFAEERRLDEAALRRSLKNPKARKDFDEDILTAKVLDFLEEHAKIKEQKVTWKDLQKRKQVAVNP